MNTSISQNVLYDEDFLSSDDTFLFDNNTLEQEIADSSVGPLNLEKSTELVVLLKQAKGRDDQFEDRFPPSLLCHPYKYDLKVIGHIENHLQHKLTLNLVDAETLVVPSVTLPNKKILEAVAVEQIEEINGNERVIRFTFNLCSFHFKRRSFKLELTQNINGTQKRLFLSDAFQTFARRREHHQSFGSVKFELAKNSSQTSSSAPLTPESNNSNSTGSIGSPKSDRQGVKRSISSVNSSYYPVTKSRNVEPTSPTILNPVPHYAPGAFTPYMFPANYAAVAAAYHQEMAQQFASMPLPYASNKMQPMYYPQQWATFQPNQFMFGNTSPVSPPSNVIAHQEKSHDVLSALIETTSEKKAKKENKQIHHVPLNFVQIAQPTPVETSDRASLAIQLFKSLTPTERQSVSLILNNTSSNV